MPRVLLIHWNEAECRERLARLEAAGFAASGFWDSRGGRSLRDVRGAPPDALVIDLSRLPSHGREVATWWRAGKDTRDVPIVFLEGDVEKVDRLKRLIPDAAYSSWRSVKSAVAKAIRNPPAKPRNPGVLAGYSGTPLPKKLGIKPGLRVGLIGAPADFDRTLGDLPEGACLVRAPRNDVPLVLLFVRSQADLVKGFPRAEKATAAGGSLWIAWPKKASGIVTDLGENTIRDFGLARGWVDYKVCAIDATWSGLLVTRRKPKG